MNYPPYHLSKRTKSVIFALFTGFFLIVAPSLAMYTAGYRLSLNPFTISQIGVLSVDMFPRDAKTWLNGKLMGESLPLRLTNLIPRTYNLRVEKEGYLPLVKDLVIEANKTTYIKSLDLFLIAKPEIVEQNNTLSDIFGSPDGNYILEKFNSENTSNFVLLNTNGELRTPLPKSSSSPDTILWSKKNNKLALLSTVSSSTLNTTVLVAENPNESTHLSITGFFHEYQWKENFYSENLLLHVDNFLYKINPRDDAQGADNIHTTSSPFFRDNNDEDWYFDSNTKTLIHTKNEKDNLVIPSGNVIKIIDINNDRAIVQTAEGLSIIKRDTTKEVKNISVSNFFYDENRKEYIAWSTWELWTIYENGTVSLLNRMSEAMLQVAALDQSGELLIVTGDKLLGFNPGYYLSQEILSGVKVEKATVNQKTRTIYFFGTWNNTKGLYKMKY